MANLSALDMELLQTFRQLSPELQEMVLELGEILIAKRSSKTIAKSN